MLFSTTNSTRTTIIELKVILMVQKVIQLFLLTFVLNKDLLYGFFKNVVNKFALVWTCDIFNHSFDIL